jgi:tRNA threonylcarbamoyladenosine biosynthesis protein TsaE
MRDNPTVRVYETASPDETMHIGRSLGEGLQPADTILLIGDLGAGKTCFIQGLCAGLGVQEAVTSPTFTLINEYEGRLPVAHFDLYRLDDPESVLNLGFDEYVDSGRICLIEWADKFLEIMPAEAIEVEIEIGEGEERRVRVRTTHRIDK